MFVFFLPNGKMLTSLKTSTTLSVTACYYALLQKKNSVIVFLTVFGDFTCPGRLTASLFLNASEHKNNKEPEANISSQRLFSDSHILNPIISSTVGRAGSGFPREPRVSCVPPCAFSFFANLTGAELHREPGLDIRQPNRWRLMSVCVCARVMSSGGRRGEVM